jgi:hypothetical protein
MRKTSLPCNEVLLTGASIIITATAYKYNQQNIPVSDKAIVTAKTRKENINWIRSFCQEMYVHIHFNFSVRISSDGQPPVGADYMHIPRTQSNPRKVY